MQGKYILSWDNSFSNWRKKSIRYQVILEAPLDSGSTDNTNNSKKSKKHKKQKRKSHRESKTFAVETTTAEMQQPEV